MRCPFITSRGYIPPLSSAGFAGAIDVLGEASEGAAEAPSDALPRLLVRDVARDDLVHRLARVADALLAHGEIDGGHGLGRRHFLDLLAGHVAHEARGHPVEPHGGLLGP